MTLRNAPPINLSRPPTVQAYEPDPALMDRWQAGLRAADARATNVISMLDVIGADGRSGDGVTARRIAAALRSITADEITVDLNSPGGDFFEGVAIYNLLREDPRRVTVRILGLSVPDLAIRIGWKIETAAKMLGVYAALNPGRAAVVALPVQARKVEAT